MNKKNLFLILAATGLIMSACSGNGGNAGEYTYHAYSSSLADNWNPHTWETNADSGVLGYISVPFVDLSIKDSKKGEYQWVYELATSVKDVTKDNQKDLEKYGCDETEAEEGYVYQVKLRSGVKFENGETLDANTAIESMKRMLSPELHNYRANNWYSGESALAGAYNYYWQGSEGYFSATDLKEYKEDLDSKLVFCITGKVGDEAVMAPSYIQSYFESNDVTKYDDMLTYLEGWGCGTADGLKAVEGKTLAEIKANPELKAHWDAIIGGWQTEPNEELHFFVYKSKVPEQSWDKVGFYKVDDLTFNFVYQTAYDWDNTMISLASQTFIVEPKLYDKSITTIEGIKTSTYGSSVETTTSFGPYKLSSFQAEKQMVFDQNEAWYGWQKVDGEKKLVSYTEFEVDGKKQQQYRTTKVVIDVMENATAKLAFEKGQLTDYTPTAAELPDYSLSKQLYQVDETYTERLFFNTDPTKLAEMETKGTNKNGKVMTSYNFRKALSLCFDRATWVTTTEAWKPACFLINGLYYYDVFNDPASIYRNTNEAKQAICDLYGIEYGEGKAYKTLDEAYASVTGYNLTEAKKLMKAACEELDLQGQEVKITVAYKKGALESADYAQINKLNEFIAAAVEGSGFKSVVLEGKGSIADRYGDVGAGTYAIGFGAWGGAAFYPFTLFRVYMDPSYTKIHEAGCWDPSTEKLTIDGIPDVDDDGKPTGTTHSETRTWQEWSKCMGQGAHQESPNCVKLYILSYLEKSYINLYYCIPLATTTQSYLLSYQVAYYTKTYNIMYDFGGLRLMKYNYDDAQWADYVAKQGGTLNYK